MTMKYLNHVVSLDVTKEILQRSRIFVSLIAILFILSFQNVYGVESEFYCKQLDGSKFFYDKNYIVYSSGKVRIWNSVILSDIGKEYVKNNFEMNNFNPYKILTYNEVDCNQRNFRVFCVIFCGYTKSILRNMDDPPNRLIVPNTCPEELFNIICKNGK
jgi:hypothetical protein